MCRRLLFLALGALVLGNLFFAYRALDSGVTITYYQVEIDNQRKAKQLLARIAVILAEGRYERDLTQAVERAVPGHVVDREGDTFFVDEVGLRFEQGRLTEVVFLNDPPEDAQDSTPVPAVAP